MSQQAEHLLHWAGESLRSACPHDAEFCAGAAFRWAVGLIGEGC